MIKRVTDVILIGIVVSSALAIIKIVAGILGNAQSLMFDGINSLTDVLIAIGMFFIVRVANKAPDKNHPYGHQKYEGVFYFVIGIFLILTSIIIVGTNVIDIINYQKSQLIKPEIYTLYVVILSVILKVVLFRFYRKYAKAFSSPSLKADSYNHLSDILATSASLIGIVLTRFNIHYVDLIASVLIGFFILRAGILIVKEAISYLVDEAPPKTTVKAIKQMILSVDDKLHVDDLKVRKHMSGLYVDVEISLPSHLTLEESHSVAEAVHDKIELEFEEVLHCMVHVNPY